MTETNERQQRLPARREHRSTAESWMRPTSRYRRWGKGARMPVPKVNVKRRKNRWYVDFRVSGQRYQWSVSDYGKPGGKRLADEAAETITRSLIAGTFKPERKPWEPEPEAEAPKVVTLRQLVVELLETKVSKRKSTVAFYDHCSKPI